MKNIPSGSRGRIVRMVVVDLLAFGLALCIFAYFHHVRQPDTKPVVLPTPSQTAAPTITPDVQATPGPSTGDPGATTSEQPAATPEPAGLLGAKYAEKFTAGEVVQDATSYRSANVALELTQERRYDSLVHIVDIYLRDITSFHAVTCKEAFGENLGIAAIGEALPGALAISSSDQYRNRPSGQWGFIVNDGLLYSSDTNVYDFAVLYLDGTMEVYEAGTVDFDSLVARGIRQAWTFGPALVKGGEAVGSYDGAPARMQTNNPRVAIGYYEPGHYCLVMVDGTRASNSGSKGATLDELTELFLSLGCTEALNLDGGGTVAMRFGSQTLNTSTRSLTNAIYISEPDAAQGGN